jgi:uncharacterized protein
MSIELTPSHEPFHVGELTVQQRAGVPGAIVDIGRQAIRDYMPDQHREFFAQLPFVVTGTLGTDGQPWASLLAGHPGFIQSPDSRTLVLNPVWIANDPVHSHYQIGMPLGLLGIEPHTRRRNRMNGIVTALAPSLTVSVIQSFGNCPKYIQAREPVFGSAPTNESVRHSPTLDRDAIALIARADTFFIASSHPAAGAHQRRSESVDVSHRGGKPGFVRVASDRTLWVPDFSGNRFFNTLGNLMLEPRAGLLFVDFAHGDLLYLAVRAEIIWDGPDLANFIGAERLLRFEIQATVTVNAVPVPGCDRAMAGGKPLATQLRQHCVCLSHQIPDHRRRGFNVVNQSHGFTGVQRRMR